MFGFNIVAQTNSGEWTTKERVEKKKKKDESNCIT
jgi:hypothetical protein